MIIHIQLCSRLLDVIINIPLKQISSCFNPATVCFGNDKNQQDPFKPMKRSNNFTAFSIFFNLFSFKRLAILSSQLCNLWKTKKVHEIRLVLFIFLLILTRKTTYEIKTKTVVEVSAVLSLIEILKNSAQSFDISDHKQQDKN